MKRVLFYLIIFSLIQSTFLITCCSAQSLNHTRDLNIIFSPETLSKGAFSLQGIITGQESEYLTFGGAAIGLGRYIDFLAAYSRPLNSNASNEDISIAIKIGDPPFFGHYLGLMPSVKIPLSGNSKAIAGLSFMHVIEPQFIAYPTKFYLNYGYFSQDKNEIEQIFTHRDYFAGGLGAKLAISRSVVMAEFNMQTFLDFDTVSFQESRFSLSAGTRIAFIGGTSLSAGAIYSFSGRDAATAYEPKKNEMTISLGLTRVIFPVGSRIRKLKAMLAEQIDSETEDNELTAIHTRQQLVDRDIEALKQLLNDNQKSGGRW